MFHLEDSPTLYYDTTYNCDKRTGTIVMLAQRLLNAIGISENISGSSGLYYYYRRIRSCMFSIAEDVAGAGRHHEPAPRGDGEKKNRAMGCRWEGGQEDLRGDWTGLVVLD